MKKLMFLSFVFTALLCNAQFKVLSNGNIGISTTNPLTTFQIYNDYTKMAFGSASTFTNGVSYMGFNVVRQSSGTWLSANNGTKNGGSVIYGDLDGAINFATIASTGSSDQTYSNSTVTSNTMVKFGTACYIATGTNNPPSGCKNYFKGWKTILENTVSNKGVLNIELSQTKPRFYNTLSGVTTAIVLINSSGSYQDIELGTVYYYGQLTPQNQLKSTINSITDAISKIDALHGKISNDAIEGVSSTYIDANELQQVMPELVKTVDSNQTKLVNYTGIIPYLIEAIKEQQQIIASQESRISTLETDLSDCCKIIKSDSKLNESGNTSKTTSAQSAYLLQNTPNPFNAKTTIYYYIPENTTSATLMIFDMQGKFIKTYAVNSRKEGSTEINGGEMQPGMYMYSLIIDGKEFDTKRMILTN